MKKSELKQIIREEIQKLNEIDKSKVKKINTLLKKMKADPDHVSPNFVADVANQNNVKLTNDEVVYISDNF